MFEDILKMTFGHALIMGHAPNSITLEQVQKRHEVNPTDIKSMGFFDTAAPNYATYYPDAKPEDFVAGDSDFIQPLVRALSEVTVHKAYQATSFAKPGVLKASLEKLYGQTIYIDHETSIGNALGTVSEVSWEPGYTSKDGVEVPPGINARLKIDAKSNPRLARLMNMDPPAIHSFSVTVQFAWEPSHKTIPLEEFYSKLGTYDDKGNLYQRVVNEVKSYKEISLVNHGADPYAKIIKDGQIVNPKYADLTYKNSENKLCLKAEYMDFREGFIQNSETPTIPQPSIIINNTEKIMKEILLLLQATFAITGDNKTDAELAEEVMPKLVEHLGKFNETALSELNTQLEAATGKLSEAQTAIDTLKNAQTKEPDLLAAGEKYLETLRNEAKTLSTLLNEGKTDTATQALLETANLATLTILKNQYQLMVDKTIPLQCNECHSTKVSRGTAQVKNTENTEAKETLANKTKEKSKAAVDRMHGKA